MRRARARQERIQEGRGGRKGRPRGPERWRLGNRSPQGVGGAVGAWEPGDRTSETPAELEESAAAGLTWGESKGAGPGDQEAGGRSTGIRDPRGGLFPTWGPTRSPHPGHGGDYHQTPRPPCHSTPSLHPPLTLSHPDAEPRGPLSRDPGGDAWGLEAWAGRLWNACGAEKVKPCVPIGMGGPRVLAFLRTS